jgi:hypothetical protein
MKSKLKYKMQEKMLLIKLANGGKLLRKNKKDRNRIIQSGKIEW